MKLNISDRFYFLAKEDGTILDVTYGMTFRNAMNYWNQRYSQWMLINHKDLYIIRAFVDPEPIGCIGKE